MEKRILDYFSQKLSQKERIQLMQEVSEDTAVRSEFIRYRNLMGLTALGEQSGDDAEGRQHYVQFIAEKTRPLQRARKLRIVRYAAVAALLVIGSWAVLQWSPAGRTDRQPVALNTMHVPAGQRASVTLSDSTVVWLNANSTLTYPAQFGAGERRVSVTGEAFFTVTKAKDHPFIVTTSTVDIKVLGTVFNVSDYTGATHVSLLEGQIEIGLPDDTDDKILMAPDQNLTYTDGKATVTSGINEQEFLWRDGLVHFQELPLSVIAERLSRYYDVEIEIADPRVANRTYTGKFRLQDGVGEILRIIQRAQKFNITKDDSGSTFVIR